MFNVNYKEGNVKESVIMTDIPYLKNPDFLCVVGSKLYGTDNEDSDLDIRGFTFLPKEFLLGIKKFEQHQNITSGDIVVWSVEKYVKMLLNGSSVAFEMLFCPDNLTIRKSEVAQSLIQHKTWFISQRVIKSALAYAQSEWRKVLGDGTRDLGKQRKEHIEERGYSYKNASHAIRILDLFYDLAEYGLMQFPVGGHQFIKAVKEGDVNFTDAKNIYSRNLQKLEDILPNVPEKQEVEKINNLLVSLNLKLLLQSEINRIINLPV